MPFSLELFIKSLNDSFPAFTISYEELTYNGKIPVFFVRSTRLDELEANWTKLIEAIAFDFQSQLTDEFQIWNIYVFFTRPPGITDVPKFNSLKLKIENDTFSSRKILVDDEETDAIIKEHIINSNVHFAVDELAAPAATFEANALLWSILEDKTLKKQKLTGEAGSAFDELLKQLKKTRP